MSENQKKILQMLAEGKVSVDEATRLLYLIGEQTGTDGREGVPGIDKPLPKYLYIRVEPKANYILPPGKKHQTGRVNVRVPVGLIKAGMKLKALIPPQAAEEINEAMREKGISFDIRDLKDEYIEDLLKALSETEISVDSEEAEVHIHAE